LLKKISFIVLCILLISLLAGCSGGAYTISIGDIGSSGNSISGSYDSFSGHYYKTAKFEKGQTINFSFSANTVSCELSARVIDSKGNTVVELKGDQSVQIDKTDTYKIQVEGQKHQGGLLLSWSELK
jgi:hypothetical protein